MAKQMKRVEKRYVPQQESYRSLPALSPQASPVDVTPSVAPVDASAEKLRQLAEGLSSLNKGLGDFLRMEKSFEETNRLANRTNALLGLPPVSGPGFTDMGVEKGYKEGQGLSDSIRLRDELLTELSDKQFFVNPDSLPDTISNVNKFTQEFIQGKLAGKETDVSYLEGAAKNLTQVKIEALTVATKMQKEARDTRQLNNEASIISENLKLWSDDVWRSPDVLREKYNELMSSGNSRGLPKDAMGSLILQVAENNLVHDFGVAHDSKDLKLSRANLLKMQSIVAAATLPDKAGQPIGSFKKGKDGNPEWVLESDVSAIVRTRDKMVRDYESLLKETTESFKYDIQANIFTGLSDGTLSAASARESIRPLATSDSKSFLEIQKFIDTLEKNQSFIDDSEVVSSLLKTGNYDISQITYLLSKGQLSNDGASTLAKAYSWKEREKSSIRNEEYHQRRMYNLDEKDRLDSVKRSNAAVSQQYVHMYGTDSAVSDYVRQANIQGKSVTPEELDLFRVRREEDTRRKTAVQGSKTPEDVKSLVVAAGAMAAGDRLSYDEQKHLTNILKHVPQEEREAKSSEILQKRNAVFNTWKLEEQRINTKFPRENLSGSALVEKTKALDLAKNKYIMMNPTSSPEARRIAINFLSQFK